MKNKIVKEMINPLYYIGEKHNMGLEFVGIKLDVKNLSIEKTMDEVCNYIITICPDKSGFSNTALYKQLASLIWNNLVKNGTNYLPDTASYLQKQFFHELNNICCKDINLIEQLLDLEKRVLWSELGKFEQEPILVAIQVGISSNQYWNTQIENYEKSVWKKIIKKDELIKKHRDIEGYDRAGATVGFLVGAAFGVSALLGAVIGAVAASAGAIVNENLENK